MNAFLKKFFATDTNSWALLIVRLALAIVVLPHGMQKALGMYGGYGFEATVGFFSGMGIPAVLGVMVILAEFVAPILLILGVGSRFMAFSIFLTLGGAMFLGGHVQHGFFMNWFGNQTGEGMEYFILIIGMSLGLMFGGAGKYALDTVVGKYIKE
ncbi:MAG: DoxX family protein [Paludibacter sp.]|jgi:putative oxidoreductase|nr:DoxX family protein [Paludibacter sp.]